MEVLIVLAIVFAFFLLPIVLFIFDIIYYKGKTCDTCKHWRDGYSEDVYGHFEGHCMRNECHECRYSNEHCEHWISAIDKTS